MDGGAPENDEVTQLQGRLGYLAWRWYRIPAETAEELVQAAHVTYLQVKARYPKQEEHPKIFMGIYRNKCREYIDGQVRAARKLRALQRAAEAGDSGIGTPEELAGDGLLTEMVHREDHQQLLAALAELRPEAREMFRLITEEGLTRADLIQRLGLNKNTFDSRLHTYRKELRKLLARRGLTP